MNSVDIGKSHYENNFRNQQKRLLTRQFMELEAIKL